MDSKYNNVFKQIMEARISGDEFIANLGDNEEREVFYAKQKKEEVLKLWQEYVSEAEHQDGYSYWSNFDSIAEIIDDFNIYVQSSKNK